jgi:hypothetical protein
MRNQGCATESRAFTRVYGGIGGDASEDVQELCELRKQRNKIEDRLSSDSGDA